MRYHVFTTAEEAGAQAGLLLASYMRENPAGSLGLATGNTVLPIYRSALGEFQRERPPSLANLRTIALDEWVPKDGVPLQIDDERTFGWSLETLIRRELADRYGYHRRHNHSPKDVHVPGTPLVSGRQYPEFDELLLDLGGIGLQIVGLRPGPESDPGASHVGFAEPGFASESEWLDWRTFACELLPESRETNIHYPGCNGKLERVPSIGITMAPGTLLRCVRDRLILAAYGTAKAPAVASSCEGPVGPHCPVSVVQLIAESGIEVDCFFDTEAAALLKRKNRIA